MARRRSVSILVIFVGAFAFWLALFAVAGTSGFPARLILNNTCERAGLEVARAAFSTEGLESADYVVAGTPDFVGDVSKSLPKSAVVVRVPLGTVSLKQFERVANVFKHKLPTSYIFQNAPHLWIDIDHSLARGTQNTRAWDLRSAELTIANSLAVAKESFKSLSSIVAKKCKTTAASPSLPPSFLWTSFLPEPLMSRRRNEFRPSVKIGRGRRQMRIVWVFDPEWIPEDAMDDTRKALIEFATGPREVDRLGEIVSLDALPEYLQRDID